VWRKTIRKVRIWRSAVSLLGWVEGMGQDEREKKRYAYKVTKMGVGWVLDVRTKTRTSKGELCFLR
jgi:hypothetical protein